MNGVSGSGHSLGLDTLIRLKRDRRIVTSAAVCVRNGQLAAVIPNGNDVRDPVTVQIGRIGFGCNVTAIGQRKRRLRVERAIAVSNEDLDTIVICVSRNNIQLPVTIDVGQHPALWI